MATLNRASCATQSEHIPPEAHQWLLHAHAEGSRSCKQISENRKALQNMPGSRQRPLWLPFGSTQSRECGFFCVIPKAIPYYDLPNHASTGPSSVGPLCRGHEALNESTNSTALHMAQLTTGRRAPHRCPHPSRQSD
jgi:hypothetical protein